MKSKKQNIYLILPLTLWENEATGPKASLRALFEGDKDYANSAWTKRTKVNAAGMCAVVLEREPFTGSDLHRFEKGIIASLNSPRIKVYQDGAEFTAALKRNGLSFDGAFTPESAPVLTAPERVIYNGAADPRRFRRRERAPRPSRFG
ncbi:MAG: hypothetical protein AB7G06_04860 [Bdellovibrionales bacterium]